MSLPGIPEGPTPIRKGLVTLLANAADGLDAARKIAAVPAMREELERSGAEIVAEGKPPAPEALRAQVIEFFGRYGITEEDVAANPSAPDGWVSILGHLPLEATVVAMHEVGHESAILPKPDAIARAAVKRASELQVISYRAKVAMDQAERARPPKTIERMTHAEMIERGFLNTDGSVNMNTPASTEAPKVNTPPARPSRHSRAATIERLRRTGQ